MRIHRSAMFIVATTSLAISAAAQPALRAAPSTRATSVVSLVPAQSQVTNTAPPLQIKLDYGQPHLRGRMMHTDSLVPYDTPWRLGANAATRLATDVDLVVGGTTLVKGTYVLFALPGRSGWKLIVQKDGDAPEVPYEQANDIARIDLRRASLSQPLESLTMTLIPATTPGAVRGELRISWGTVLLATDWSVK